MTALEQIAARDLSSAVELWTADLDGHAEHAAELAAVLARDERLRACRFKFDRDRRRFVICRGLLRCVLARRLDVDPEDIQFEYGPFGKPQLGGRHGQPVGFNVSHADGYALLAVTSGCDIGVDIERIRPLTDLERLADMVFSPVERTALAALPAGDKVGAFFSAWTRKEAYLKARGDGLQRALDGFDVTLAPGEPARLLRVAAEPDEPSRWTLSALNVPAGYAAAVCVEQPSTRT